MRRRTGRWRDALRRRYLAVADVFAVSAACAVTGLLVAAPLFVLATVPVWIVLAKLQGLYDQDHRVLRHLTSDELGGLVAWAAIGVLILSVLAGATSHQALGAAESVQLVIALALIAPVTRAAGRRLWRATVPPERVLVVGSGPVADSARRKLEVLGDTHQELVSEAIEPDAVADLDGARITLDAILSEQHLDRVVVAAETLEEAVIVSLAVACRERLLKLGFVPPAPGAFGSTAQLGRLAELPVVDCLTWDPPRSTRLLKRALDIGGATLVLVLSAPLLLVVGAVVRLTSPGPAIYRQQRAGVDGRPFWMWKFRTMSVDAEERLEELVPFNDLVEPVFKLSPDPRVTRVGRFLRRTSIDELPQLVNVLRGQMSLVGPRPEQIELVAHYGEADSARLAIRPGMTGPMQVFGRGQLGFDERLRLERDYIETLSVTGDVRILLRTIGTVLSGRGAS